MGLDLALLPFDGRDFSHTVLNCYDGRVVFEKLLDEQSRLGKDVPENFRCYLSTEENSGEHCYGVVTEDHYGEPLKYLKAKQLVNFFSHIPPDLLSTETLAIVAFLEKTPPDRKVALMWK